MDTQSYPDIIKQVLSHYADYMSPTDPVKAHFVFDEQHQSYLMVEIGWRDKQYIYQPIIHIEIIDGKIWIQQDYTEAGVVDDLIDAGVAPEQIVLGFRHPSLRQYTGFAVR